MNKEVNIYNQTDAYDALLDTSYGMDSAIHLEDASSIVTLKDAQVACQDSQKLISFVFLMIHYVPNIRMESVQNVSQPTH